MKLLLDVVAVTVIATVAAEVGAVPEIVPLDELMVMPAGRPVAVNTGAPIRPPTASHEYVMASDTVLFTTDVWSVGCLFAEFLQHSPLFGQARSEIDLLDRMFKLLGTVTEAQWPGLSELKNYASINFYVQPENRLRAAFSDIGDAGFDLLNRMLTYDPSRRITAKDALQHAYFQEAPRAKSAAMMPTWPSTLTTSNKH